MENVDVLQIEDLDNLVQNTQLKEIVFWVGARVDHESPTNLPIGNGLTDFHKSLHAL